MNCPFGAISDKGQIFQVIQAIKKGERVIAAVAPAFVGQFGPQMTVEKLRPAMKLLGFDNVAEVAVGADLCTIEEAKDFLREVPEHQPHGHKLLPRVERDGKKALPRFRALYLHGADAYGAHRAPFEKEHPAARWCLLARARPKSWRPAAAPSAAMWILCSPSRK